MTNPYGTPNSDRLEYSARNGSVFGWVILVPVILAVQVAMMYWDGDEDPFFGSVSPSSARLALTIHAVIILAWLLWSATLVLAVAQRWLKKWCVLWLVLAAPGVGLAYVVVVTHLSYSRH